MELGAKVLAAVGTPRRPDGGMDEAALGRSLEFVLERGIGGIVLNGATGEYPLTTLPELDRMLRLAHAACGRQAVIVCGIGSASVRRSVEAGQLAAERGARAVLLPMPYFFPYAQDDLEAFVQAVARELPLPALLYNLPRFTTGLELATVRTLLRQCRAVAQ